MSQWQLSANARALLKVLRGEWTLAVSRFPDLLGRRMSRDVALREIARCFLCGAGTTARGELSRVTGLSRPDAGRGNRSLVAEGYATIVSPCEPRSQQGIQKANRLML